MEPVKTDLQTQLKTDYIAAATLAALRRYAATPEGRALLDQIKKKRGE